MTVVFVTLAGHPQLKSNRRISVLLHYTFTVSYLPLLRLLLLFEGTDSNVC